MQLERAHVNQKMRYEGMESSGFYHVVRHYNLKTTLFRFTNKTSNPTRFVVYLMILHTLYSSDFNIFVLLKYALHYH